MYGHWAALLLCRLLDRLQELPSVDSYCLYCQMTNQMRKHTTNYSDLFLGALCSVKKITKLCEFNIHTFCGSLIPSHKSGDFSANWSNHWGSKWHHPTPGDMIYIRVRNLWSIMVFNKFHLLFLILEGKNHLLQLQTPGLRVYLISHDGSVCIVDGCKQTWVFCWWQMANH